MPIETLFGEVKHVLGLTRLRLRGLTGARDEFLLAATVQNLKRLIKHAGPAPPMPIAAYTMRQHLTRRNQTSQSRPAIEPRRKRKLRPWFQRAS